MTRTRALRINAVELLRHPGASRRIEATLDPADILDPTDISVDDDRLAGQVAVDLEATSSVDGVVVRGTVRTPWHGQCRRCLIDVDGVSVSEIDELFQEHPRHDEAIEIVGDQIDLAPIVREYVLLDLPEAPLCREDCAGICPTCGVDRNTVACECVVSAADPRWSALEGLRLDPDNE